jgi:hypothetical protein
MFCGIHLSQQMFSEVLLIYYKFIVYSVHIICLYHVHLFPVHIHCE